MLLAVVLVVFTCPRGHSYTSSIQNFLANPGSFSQMSRLLAETRLDALLSKGKLIGGGPYTLIAPTDAAFSTFGRLGLLTNTKNTANNAANLEKFVKYHILPGRRRKKSLRPRSRERTLTDEALEIDFLDNILYSIDVDNGIIHVIDKVLVNPALKKIIYP